MMYHHPLAYLVGMEGLALLRAWNSERDERWVRARLAEVRALLDDETLSGHPGVVVETGATAEAYGEWAPTYDVDGNQLLAMDLPLIDRALDGLEAGTALDAGCGTGRLTERLASRGWTVTGIDASAPMLRRARSRVPAAQFVEGDLCRLPLADFSVDLALTGLAMTHVADLRTAYAELGRVVRPGGTALVSEVHPDLVARGSVVKGEGPEGPLVAACHHHGIGDHLRAALAAGFAVRHLAEEPAASDADLAGDPPAAPAQEVGPWRWWPWSLLPMVPEAARTAWREPSVMVWHLEKVTPQGT